MASRSPNPRSSLRDDPAFLFSLRFKLSSGPVEILAWEGPWSPPNHTRVFWELRASGRVILPKGVVYVGIPSHATLDGAYAKEACASHAAMHPGDGSGVNAECEHHVDAGDHFGSGCFWDGYSQEALDWATANGEELDMLVDIRFHDENGNLRKGAR